MMYRADLLEIIASRASHIVEPLIKRGGVIDFLDKERRPFPEDEVDLSGAVLDWDESSATIWSAQGRSLHHIFHALLHLNRYWVQGVPQFWDQSRGCKGVLYELETTYEHLVVIPVEIAHYPEAFSYWVNLAEEQLYNFKSMDLSSSTDKARFFQFYLLSLAAFPRSQVASSIAAVVHEKALMDEFSELSNIVFKNFQQKAFVLESLCRYRMGSAPSSLGLRWLEKTEDGGQEFAWAPLQDYETKRETPAAGEPSEQRETPIVSSREAFSYLSDKDVGFPYK